MTTRTDLVAARTNLVSRGSIIKGLEELNERNRTKLVALEESADLSDSKSLSKLTECRVLADLIPKRIEAARREHAEAEAELIRVCGKFSREFLMPRLTNQKAIAEKLVKGQLEAILTDSDSLEAAIENSDLVKQIHGLMFSGWTGVPIGPEAMKYADALFALLEASEALDPRLKG